MRRFRPRLLLGIGIPLLIVIVLLAAWGVDASRTSGKVPRNVKLAGTDIGGLPEDKLAAAVGDVASTYEHLKVQVRTQSQTFTATTGDLGLRLDQAATIRAALDLDKDTSVFARPFVWASSFAEPRTASLRFTIDNGVLESGLAKLAGNSAAVEPTIVAGSDGLAVISGKAGSEIDGSGVRDQLLAKARSGETPIIVDARIDAKNPAITDTVAQDFVNRVNATTANGIKVHTGDHEAVIPAITVRSWLGAKYENGAFVLTMDEAKAKVSVEAALKVDTEARSATFTVVDGAVQSTPGQDGQVCCTDDTAKRVYTALTSDKNDVEVELKVTKPEVSNDDIAKLGIKEPVGSTTTWKGQPQVKSFTTYYQAGQPRVTNIHRIADAVRGTVILPGEKFSMNDIVGQRTTAKGYVAAGAIANGEHVDEVGGGVSQFATTTFNAVYFAGLKINTYQAHSEHFDRYPLGREATMGFPAPDLVWTNNSPYGILVWTSYTNTSVTVTLYSTQWATAEQTGSSSRRSGNCTIVTTTRTIHYPDGKTGTDQFQARYRDSGKTSC
jgi:vancomycin resistance protein YoaR